MRRVEYQTFFKEGVQALKAAGRYRVFVALERQTEKHPCALWHRPDGSVREVISWCSNDYLDMRQQQALLAAAKLTLGPEGTGGTHNIAGCSDFHVETDTEIADLHGREAALLMPSGYVPNEPTLGAVGGMLPNAILLSNKKQSGQKSSGQQRQAALPQEKVAAANLPRLPSLSYIVPLHVGDATASKQASEMLLQDFGICVQPIDHPTVLRDTERLRFTPGPMHENRMIEELVMALQYVWTTLVLPCGRHLNTA